MNRKSMFGIGIMLRMGICRVRLRRQVRYVHARHYGRDAAARERRQVRRVRVPYESEGERLRVYGVRETVNDSPARVAPCRDQ